ncbi:MAG: hypothetical protein OQK82_03870 [Candidatus Pacearchaeota archaeon]|nr:hypothetical protein [Candidatus Pacearchaeota archaeon]
MATKKAKKAVNKKTGNSVKKKAATKKFTAKKIVAAAKKKVIRSKPPGYEVATESGILTRTGSYTPVPANKLRTGFKKAKKEIDSIVEEIASTMTESYTISEIELSASFSADGKFMGFGVGGAATIKIKITPETN